MNLVGKIFVVVIFVMALVFMALTMAVYTAQRNWRDVVLWPQDQATPNKEPGLKYQLEDANRKLTELKDDKDKLVKQYDAEKAAQQQALSKMQTELELVRKERRSLDAGRADLEKEKRDAVAAMKATQTNATDFRQQLDKLRTSLLESQRDRDAHFKEVVRLTDLLNQAVNDKEQLRKRMVDLAGDLKRADKALEWSGVNKNADFENANPPKVDGLVTSVLEGGLVEISLGSDDGIRKGHVLHISRVGGGQNTYVGRVEVVKTDPSKSVCRVDPKFQNSNIMVNDRVDSKIE